MPLSRVFVRVEFELAYNDFAVQTSNYFHKDSPYAFAHTAGRVEYADCISADIYDTPN